MKLERGRFHVSTGPPELFARVREVMAAVTRLDCTTTHFDERQAERGAPPVTSFEQFDSLEWELMAAEVRIDTGKFLASTWKRTFGHDTWWIVIGLHNALITAYRADPAKVGAGASSISFGTLYEKVASVNAELLRKSSGGEPPDSTE